MKLNKAEMNQKLDILKDNKIITDLAYDITNETFDLMSEKYKRPIYLNPICFGHICAWH